MKKNNNLKHPDSIRYIKRLREEDDTTFPVNGYHRVENAKTIRYQGSTLLLFTLDTCSRCLLDWLTDNTKQNNIVFSHEYQLKQFIALFKEATGKEYTMHTVRLAFKKLLDRGLITRINRATYQVNPEYFFSGTFAMSERERERERTQLIRKNLEAGVKKEPIPHAINQ
jgi:hypothetical protein